MPPNTKFNTETPRKLKTSSVPRNVQNFEIPALKESFHSELSASIFDEGLLPSEHYKGDIIADCWFPDKILPVVPSAELLNALTGPDGRPLYDSSTKQWDTRYLPPILHKVQKQHRLGLGQEEKELSTFMGTVMDALIRQYNDGRSSATASVLPESTEPSCPSLSKTNSSTPAPLSPAIPPSERGTSMPATFIPTASIPNPPSPLLSNGFTRTSTDPVSTPDVLPPLFPSSAEPSTSISRPLSLNTASTPASASTPAPDSSIPTSSSLSSDSPSRSDPDASASWSSRRPNHEFPPRLWSSVAATQPLSGDSQLKPDCMLVRQPADGVTKAPGWADVLMTAELTSRQQTLNLTVQIESKVLAMFDAQPNRAFSYSLSFHSGQYRLCMYDRAGGVYSRSYDLHESPLPLLRVLCAATFAQTSWLGLEDTFDCRLHPVINVDGVQYFVVAKCFSTSVIRGRATTVWFVSKSVPPCNGQAEIFVIKDSWVNVERRLSEEEILQGLEGVDCVPKVKRAWTVQRDGQDDSTSLRRPTAFMSFFKRSCDHRIHRRLILTPAGRPITHAASPLEVVTCLLDLVITHKQMWLLGYLHRDVSINNSMIYEETLPDGTVRVRGLLIDFDYSIKVDELDRTAGPGDRTGTLPFMATELLRATNDTSVKHTPAHDLESFVYLLCWIVTLYDGPNSQLRNDSQKLALEGWYEGSDLAASANNKEGCMSSASHLHDITKYYSELSPCVSALSKLVHEQHQYIRNARELDQVNYLTGSKRSRSVENTGPPLNHDAVISILRRTCMYLNNQEISEKDILQPFYLTKKDHTRLVSGEVINVCSSTNILDLGGGRYSKKRRILRRIRGPKAV